MNNIHPPLPHECTSSPRLPVGAISVNKRGEGSCQAEILPKLQMSCNNVDEASMLLDIKGSHVKSCLRQALAPTARDHTPMVQSQNITINDAAIQAPHLTTTTTTIVI